MSKNIFKERRFSPFFLTQFLGAFNDNVFKNSLMIMLTYQTVKDSALLVNIAALLFILPFFLFSALSGQLGDKFEKSSLIRKIKLLEIMIMLLGSVFFIMDYQYGLIGVLFLMGTQSALFGPVKYSILPQHLSKDTLLKGNAYVETGTFIAILLGTIYAGVIIQFGDQAKYYVAGSVVILSILGYISSCWIPEAPASNKDLKINYNLVTETGKMFGLLKKQMPSVSRSVLGISWFWFVGAVFLTQFPIYTKEFLHSGENMVIVMMTLFSIGIGVGSVLCEKLSDKDVELGLVPVGCLGITAAGVWLYFATLGITFPNSDKLLEISEFLALDGSLSVFFAVGLIGVFGGFYTVPMYTIIQMRTEEKERSRIIAANNVINSLFMVVAAIYSIFALQHLTVLELILSVVIINLLIGLYIFTIVPEFTMRFLVFCILKFMYRIKKKNVDFPMEGAFIGVGNHVSFMDGLIISAVVKRPMRFVMYYKIYNLPVLNFIFKQMKMIPIAGMKEDKQVFDAAFEEMAKALENGEALFIFPEGKLTRDGEINQFKSGIEHIIKRTPVPVYTMALQGLWGSFFSRKKGKVPFGRIYSKVTVIGGDKVEPQEATKEKLQEMVQELRGDKQ